MNKQLLFFFFTFFVSLSSCSTYKKIAYFQDLDKSGPLSESINNYEPLKIHPGDILGINVSSLSPEASALFNSNLNRGNGNNFDSNPSNPVIGYLVDNKGEILLPIIGNIKVLGMTTTALGELLKQKLVSYLKESTITVRLLNFKVAVMGDVARPDVYAVQNEKITITEALTRAGDLTITAKRNVLLIREIDGKRMYYPIDLNSKAIFNSPYYYMENNDILYVEPSRTKYATVDRGYRTATLLISALTAVAVVVSTIIR